MFLHKILVVLAITAFAQKSFAEPVLIEDQGTSISEEELTYIVAHLPEQMRQAAANDTGDMLEVMNLILAAKKIAAEAKDYSPEDDPKVYWEQQLRIRNINRQFVVNNYMRDIEMPDMTALAEERYKTEKDKYAAVPEERLSSHILMMCAPPDCNRSEYKEEVEKVLADLLEGANFEEMAAQYSEDPGSKDKGGKFDRWLQKGKFSNVAPQYHEAVFKIEKVGDYSPVTESTFGFHIIRLDEVRPKRYLPYEDVKAAILADLNKEYRELAAKEFDSRYSLTESAIIDMEALDKFFAGFRAADPNKP